MKTNNKILKFFFVIFILSFIFIDNCSKKISLVGSYELISRVENGATIIVDPSDPTLKLIINTDGRYSLSQIEDRKTQHTAEGEYTIEKNQISFTNFIDVGVAIFSFTFENNLLALKVISLDGKDENIPTLNWTFKRM